MSSYRYAARAHQMKPSEIRALFAVASRPEVVSLAGGMPSISGLPIDALAETMHDLVAEAGPRIMQYASAQGDPRLRDHICAVMAAEGITAQPSDVVVTVGSQQALDLITRVCCDPGDVVICEGPSYVGALGVFAGYQCEIVHVAIDDNGIIPEALAATLDRLTASGKRPKLLYTVPNFANPTGVTAATDRRADILRACAAADMLVVEDNPYGLLGFDTDPKPAMLDLDPERVVYLGSFSKTFAPGFRVGWAVAPPAIRDKLVLAQEASTLCPPTFSQAVVARYLERYDWQRQIKEFCQLYAERRDAMLTALGDFLPQGQWNVPAGGFYVWVRAPAGVDTSAMLPRAISTGVAYVPGTAFFADGSGADFMRLSYCFPPPERIREGVRRLAATFAAAGRGAAVEGSRTA